jgi:hypothetical protein
MGWCEGHDMAGGRTTGGGRVKSRFSGVRSLDILDPNCSTLSPSLVPFISLPLVHLGDFQDLHQATQAGPRQQGIQIALIAYQATPRHPIPGTVVG